MNKERQYKYDVRYFIMKCNNQRNLEISMSKGIWATTQANEKKLNKAFKESKKVILIFSVQGSGHFQGFAQMTSPISREKCREFGSNLLTGSFSVTWMKCVDVPFQHAHHLINPWNDHKKVQISRDGQELEPSVGEALCKVWNTEQTNKAVLPRQGRSGTNQDRPYTENYNHRPVEQPHLQAPSHGQWPNIPTSVSVSPYGHSAQAPILFAAHPASMPIPVPMAGAHQHGPTMMLPQQAYAQQMQQPHMQAALTYSAQALTLQAGQGYPPGAANAQMSMNSQTQASLGLMHVIGHEEYMGMPPQ